MLTLTSLFYPSGISELSQTAFEFISHSLLGSPLSRVLGITGRGLRGGALLITGAKVPLYIILIPVMLLTICALYREKHLLCFCGTDVVSRRCFVNLYVLLSPHREVGRALCLEPSVPKQDNIWMHMWR